MTHNYFAQLFPAVCAGLGLFLVGGVNLLLARRRIAFRIVGTLAGIGVALAVAAAFEEPGVVLGTAKLLGLALLPCLVLASRRLVNGLSALIASLQRPAVRYAIVALGGVGLVFGSVIQFEQADEAALDTASIELESMAQSQLVVNEEVKATTDRGNRVPVKEPVASREGFDWTGAEDRTIKNGRLEGQVIRHGGATERANCHGWVFAGGKFNVPGDSVEMILKENGYQEVVEPRSGDLAIYRQAGAVVHTALVRYVAEGQPVMVEGKWGSLGVFLHPADKSNYGTEYTFYRSARHGHLLVGLGGSPSPQPAQAVTTE